MFKLLCVFNGGSRKGGGWVRREKGTEGERGIEERAGLGGVLVWDVRSRGRGSGPYLIENWVLECVFSFIFISDFEFRYNSILFIYSIS